MSAYLSLHPSHPQPRLISQTVEELKSGGIAAVPTDSGYALVAHLDDKTVADRLRRLRGLDARHHLTLLCRDLSDISHFAKIDNQQYRLLKQATPGQWTFILQATKEVPKRVSHPSRKTIGIRVPAHPVIQALLAEAGAPLLSTTLILPGQEASLVDPDEVRAKLDKQIDVILDAGNCPWEPTTVVDLSGLEPVLIRRGSADPALIGL